MSQMQKLITQLREENNAQRNNISNILMKLKNTQTEITAQSQVFSQLEEKELLIQKMFEKEKEYQSLIN